MSGKSNLSVSGRTEKHSSTKRKVAKKISCYLFAIAFILAGWQITAMLLRSPALPDPIRTLQVFSGYAAALLPDFWASTYRVLAAMLIGALPAIPIAMVFGRSKKLDALFAPVLYLLYPIPKVVILPILLVILGLGDAPKVVLIAITVFFQVLVAVRDSVRSLPQGLLLSARSLGSSRWGMYRHVIIPATMPAILTSLRISTGTAIAVLFFAEAIAGTTGLGYFIMQSWALVNYPRMFAGIIAMALLGVVVYAAIDIVEHRVTRWR